MVLSVIFKIIIGIYGFQNTSCRKDCFNDYFEKKIIIYIVFKYELFGI